MAHLLSNSALKEICKLNKVVIGLSGGVDSVVALHQVAAIKKLDSSFNVRAIHINHGLSDNASYWEEFCEATADEFGVDYQSVSLNLTCTNNIEANARGARYSAFKNMLSMDEVLITGHHEDDQLETLLLALKRGTGLDGLCCMAKDSEVDGLRIYRPLLGTPRTSIEEYAREHGLEWIEDESNASEEFDRNFLRHSIIPALKERWPSFQSSATRATMALQSTRNALAILTKEKLSEIDKVGYLSVRSIKDTEIDFQVHIVREWIKRSGFNQLSYAQVHEVVKSVINSRYAQQPLFKLGKDMEISRHFDRVYLTKINS